MDRRLTPATDRVALASLQEVLNRPAYTEGTPARVSAPLAELLTAPDGSRDRQLNFGADVTVIEWHEGWAFVQAARDGYVGWLAEGVLSDRMPAITHRVSAPATHLYPEPDMKIRELARLSVNARLTVTGVEGSFARLAQGGWVPVQAISDRFATDPVDLAEIAARDGLPLGREQPRRDRLFRAGAGGAAWLRDRLSGGCRPAGTRL